jgi:hypothetical protein
LLIANNLDDLGNLATALTNLGLGTADDVTFNSVTSTTIVKAGTYFQSSAANALTAHTGGGQGSALLLAKGINRITTVAAPGDSVKLPAAIAGNQIVVINMDASNAMDIFPTSGESINALTANTAISLVADATIMFFCAVNGKWNSILTA